MTVKEAPLPVSEQWASLGGGGDRLTDFSEAWNKPAQNDPSHDLVSIFTPFFEHSPPNGVKRSV